MSLYETIKTEVQGYIADVKSAAGDGLSLSDALSLVSVATMRFTRIAQAAGGTGPEKKAAVTTALGEFFDAIAAKINIPGVPGFLEPPIKSGIRALVLGFIGNLIDRVVGEQKAAGIF